MTIGDLISTMMWAAMFILIIATLARKLRAPKVTIKRAKPSSDVPQDHVELRIVLPKKRFIKSLAQKIQWSLDGAPVKVQKLGYFSRSIHTSTGYHQITIKIRRRNFKYKINCPVNGRYKLFLKSDRLLGGLSKDLRIIEYRQKIEKNKPE